MNKPVTREETYLAEDLRDTGENDPDSDPNLWADLKYRDGIRIIPNVIVLEEAFSQGEKGWWGNVLSISKTDRNVHTPDPYPDHWEEV